ncbi:MAG: shikimate kinase [Lentimicrobium sp.]|nr:shikimate kinase [Lentimicrobium sp.]
MGKPVFLVGYMGCGKSTAGKKLAKSLGYHFFDLDEEIEKLTGKNIQQIFSAEGEDAFRILEHSVLVSLSNRKNIVVATGGGTPCYFDNIKLMKDAGITVYLRMNAESLAKRLLLAKTKRPLIEGITAKELPAFIKEHLSRREDFYNQAKLVVKGESLDLENLIKTLKDNM